MTRSRRILRDMVRFDADFDPGPGGHSHPDPDFDPGPGRNSDPDADEPQFTTGIPESAAKVRVSQAAGRQQGRIRYEQLRALRVAESTIHDWSHSGYLFWELPRVYAVGHPGRTEASDLAAALLYAGPGSSLSHATCVWWYGLLRYPPHRIHISTPRRVQGYGRVIVHRERHLDRIVHRGLPVTTPSQAILDYAATARTDLLRFVLANAEYEGLLDVRELQSLTGRGIAGSAAVNDALQIHLPQLARTRSRGERLLLIVCEAGHVPIPEPNVYVNGWLVDAFWPHAKLIVEIDGTQGHKTPAQIRQDHRRDFELRQAGFIVLRYTEDQLERMPDAIVSELRRYL